MEISCAVCENWGRNDPHLHNEEEIEGLLEDFYFIENEISAEFEYTDLKDGIIVYRYVSEPDDLFKIASSNSIASLAKCMCIDCLRYSLSFIPHYGDGAYCTYNENLKNENPRVIHTHGINIRNMNYRVVLRIRDSKMFKKIKRTAGVIKSVPNGKSFYKNELVFSEKNSIKIICFQKWNGHEWVDILLGEDI